MIRIFELGDDLGALNYRALLVLSDEQLAMRILAGEPRVFAIDREAQMCRCGTLVREFGRVDDCDGGRSEVRANANIGAVIEMAARNLCGGA